jgi:PKD domain
MNSFIITPRHRRFSGLSIALVLCLVTAAPPVFPGPTLAQSATEAAPPGSNGNPLALGRSDLAGPVGPQPEIGDAAQVSLNATLLAEPVYGVAPLTVDFHVGLANPQSSLVYQWDFGDGAVSSLPAGAYIPHVYQRPGTYLCFLTLTNVQGRSTTLLTTVTVLPPKG